MKQKKQKGVYKLDHYTLHQETPNRWKVSGRDSYGKYRRIRYDASDLSEAIAEAEKRLFEREPLQKDPGTIELYEAFAQWLEGLTIHPNTQNNY